MKKQSEVGPEVRGKVRVGGGGVFGGDQQRLKILRKYEKNTERGRS